MRFLLAFLAVSTILLPSAFAADPSVYEIGVDPDLGFNLVAWSNSSSDAQGRATWENAVQSIHDAGFREVSISPVRFVQISNNGPQPAGTILTSSSRGPELKHIGAGIDRAKTLGMRVTVNPFVELLDGASFFVNWRGFYNPTPATSEWSTFWSDYQQYIVDVATLAHDHGADAITVGTELRAIVRNSGNRAAWANVIDAADAAFPEGDIGYAANWDNYNNANLTAAVWEHPGVDYLGVDAYFPMATSFQANNSGPDPNPEFIDLVEQNWNDLLDDEVLPFAADRQGGAGLPVEFTEYGLRPFNRTVVQHNSVDASTDDLAEQRMGFEALINAIDGRSEQLRAVHFWHWGVPGAGGDTWNMGLIGNINVAANPNNVPATRWLSQYVSDFVLARTADFNDDGAVDMLDLATWEASFGVDGGADANFDGLTDGGDLLQWQRQLTGTAVADANDMPIPEPASLLLATLALAAGAVGQLNRRQAASNFSKHS